MTASAMMDTRPDAGWLAGVKYKRAEINKKRSLDHRLFFKTSDFFVAFVTLPFGCLVLFLLFLIFSHPFLSSLRKHTIFLHYHRFHVFLIK